MALPLWDLTTPIDAPVYLDANVLVGFVTSGHSLAIPAGAVLGENLSAQNTIVLSDLVMIESEWALAKEAFRILMRQQRGTPSWGEGTYRRQHARIFGKHATVVASVHRFLGSLEAAGYPLTVVGSAMPSWLRVHERALQLMGSFRLAPADATHLAMAEVHARTFITADGNFDDVSGFGAPTGLAMFRIA